MKWVSRLLIVTFVTLGSLATPKPAHAQSGQSIRCTELINNVTDEGGYLVQNPILVLVAAGSIGIWEVELVIDGQYWDTECWDYYG